MGKAARHFHARNRHKQVTKGKDAGTGDNGLSTSARPLREVAAADEFAAGITGGKSGKSTGASRREARDRVDRRPVGPQAGSFQNKAAPRGSTKKHERHSSAPSTKGTSAVTSDSDDDEDDQFWAAVQRPRSDSAAKGGIAKAAPRHPHRAPSTTDQDSHDFEVIARAESDVESDSDGDDPDDIIAAVTKKSSLRSQQGHSGSKQGTSNDASEGASGTSNSTKQTSNGRGTTAKRNSREEESDEEDDDGAPAGPVAVRDLFLSDESGSSFADLGLQERLVKQIALLGATKPTWIQREAIPVVLTGRDVLARSPTGTGKTLAYLAPIFEQLLCLLFARICAVKVLESGEMAGNLKQRSSKKISRQDGIFALILAPTRELCIQIFAVLSGLLQGAVWIVGGTVMGGERKKAEKARIRKGLNVLIGTPGRLADHLDNTACLNFDSVRFLVLDEADRLLDLGFEKEIKAILARLPATRQTVLCSATLNRRVQALADLSLRDPVHVGLDSSDPAAAESATARLDRVLEVRMRQFSILTGRIPKGLSQFFIEIPCKLRLLALVAVLQHARESASKVIIFVSSCASVDFHAAVLRHLHDIIERKIYKLHGNLSQEERTNTYAKFVAAADGVLVSSDVAARGLDIRGVDLVLQLDPPTETEEYAHRVGRTARIGGKGQSILFLLSKETAFLELLHRRGAALRALDLARVLRKAFPESDSMKRSRFTSAFVRDRGLGAASELLETQQRIEKLVETDPRLLIRAREGYHSHVKAYSTHCKAHRKYMQRQDLHLGHLATAFGLREAPSSIGSRIAKDARKQAARDNERKRRHVPAYKAAKPMKRIKGNLSRGVPGESWGSKAN